MKAILAMAGLALVAATGAGAMLGDRTQSGRTGDQSITVAVPSQTITPNLSHYREICRNFAAYELRSEPFTDAMFLGAKADVRGRIMRLKPNKYFQDEIFLLTEISVSGEGKLIDPVPYLGFFETWDEDSKKSWRRDGYFSRFSHIGSSFSIENPYIRKMLSALLFITAGRDLSVVPTGVLTKNNVPEELKIRAGLIGAPKIIGDWYIPQVINGNNERVFYNQNMKTIRIAMLENEILIKSDGDRAGEILSIISPNEMSPEHIYCS